MVHDLVSTQGVSEIIILIHGVPEYKLLIQGVSEYIVFYNRHVPVFLPSIISIPEFIVLDRVLQKS